MAYTVKISDRLLPKCAYIRKAVFMEEQGFQQEFDEIDDRAYHALILDGETPAAVGRLYTKDGRAGEGLRRSEHCTFRTVPCGRLL